jgi:hypothetical protein
VAAVAADVLAISTDAAATARTVLREIRIGFLLLRCGPPE